MPVVVHPQVEIWDELGWIIAKGTVPPQEAGLALDEALVSLSAATAAATDNPTENGESPVPPTAVTCPVKADRRPANGDKSSVTFKFRVFRPDKACSHQIQGTKEINTELIGSKATRGRTRNSVSREVSEIPGSDRASLDDGPCLSQQQVTAAARLCTTNMSDGPTRPNTAGVTVFDDIDDLLGFSPRGSGGSGSSLASSLSGTAATSSGDGAGGFSAALGEGLLGAGAAEGDPLDESWSSAEEGQHFDSASVNANARKSDSMAMSPGPENLDRSSETAASTNAESPTRIVESRGVLRASGPEATSPTPCDNEIGAPVADDQSVVTRIGSGEGLAANVSSPETLDLPLQPPDSGINSLTGSSNDYSNYSDHDYENEEDDGGSDDDNESRASGAQSLFSFSSVSSSPSLDDDFDGLGGGSGSDDEETRAVRQHARVEMAVTATAVRLRRRLRQAAEKCGRGGSGGGNTVKAGVALLFNNLDEVRLIPTLFLDGANDAAVHCQRRKRITPIVCHTFIRVENSVFYRRRMNRNRLPPWKTYDGKSVSMVGVVLS